MRLHSLPKDVRDATIESTLVRTEGVMRELCAEQAPAGDRLLAAFDHHLAAGGRRTRARLALSASRALQLIERDAISLAASVELLHNASLVQDDLQDRDELRRGRASVWFAFGADTAIGLTDLLISASFASVAGLSNTRAIPAVLARLHSAIATTLRGQSEDLAAQGPERTVNLPASLRVARNKSGPLFAVALELPLIAAGLQAFGARARDAACDFGLGYQIADDLLDADTDRAAGAHANTVLALSAEGSFESASEAALALARRHLASAQRGTDGLPADCGALLRLMAQFLERRLSERRHG